MRAREVESGFGLVALLSCCDDGNATNSLALWAPCDPISSTFSQLSYLNPISGSLTEIMNGSVSKKLSRFLQKSAYEKIGKDGQLR